MNRQRATKHGFALKTLAEFCFETNISTLQRLRWTSCPGCLALTSLKIKGWAPNVEVDLQNVYDGCFQPTNHQLLFTAHTHTEL